MKFTRLRIERTPGIEQAFELSDLAEGFNLILGPNGSGKSRSCEVVRELLWPSAAGNSTVATLELLAGGERHVVSRDADSTKWDSPESGGSSPALPAAHHAGCYVLRATDLLGLGLETDAEIAREIQKQVAGGYDLRTIRENLFAAPKQIGRKNSKALADAQLELQRIHQEFRSLAAEEDELAELEPQLERTNQLNEQARQLELIRELAAEREALAGLEYQLSALPEGMDRLQGDELERWNEARARMQAREEEWRELEERVSRLESQLASLELPDEIPELAVLDAWLERARELGRRAAECEKLEQAARVADTRLRAARAHLVGEFESTSERVPSREQLSELEKLMRRSSDLTARQAQARARMAALPDGDVVESSETLSQGIAALRAWLEHPLLERELARMPLLVGFAMFATLIGAFLASEQSPWWSVLIGAGVALGGAAFAFSFANRRAVLARHSAQTEFAATRLEEPERWRAAGVRARLFELEILLGKAREQEQRATDRLVAAATLDELESEREGLDELRAMIATELGLDVGDGDLEVFELAKRLDEVHRASLDSIEADAKSDEAQADLQRNRQRLEAEWKPFGIVREEPSEGELAVTRLRNRVQECAHLESQLAALAERKPALKDSIEKERSAIGALWERVGITERDEGELERRMDALERYRELKQNHDVSGAQIAKLIAALPADFESLTSSQAVQALEELNEELRGRDGLLERKARAQERVETAQRGSRLSDALESIQTSRAALHDDREQAFDAVTGSFLLKRLTEEHRRKSVPRVLEEANRLFREFTHNAFELVLDSAEEDVRFRARDVSLGRFRELSELSDGTRIQLLLAARFAFALQVESEPLPFFLDEALTFSDPERFESVAHALFTLVSEGRQLFYLTSRNAELDAFEAAAASSSENCAVHLVDLAEARGLGASVRRSEELIFPLPRPIPAPRGLSAEDYGKQLAVPLPMPGQGLGSLHLFHLLRDDSRDLELLHRLLSAHISTVGQWESLHDSGAALAVAGDEFAIERLEMRRRIAKAVLEAWNVGRGRAIGRAELLQSGAVSERYLDPLAEICAEVDGDAERFLEVVSGKSDERAKGFLRKKREELEEYLIEHGMLDRRPQWTLEDAERTALAHLEDKLVAGELATSELMGLVHTLWASFEAGQARLAGERQVTGREVSAPEA